ncbi:MAG: glycosyltransferase [Chitinophagaceae bacterium]|nr:glycosyltransferase [Bacteroidota bacterium]MCC6256835.1 glycosyltransferase [Chitinophagaceae bacterium]MCW5916985.1 glycosyltransferase [Ferruginibacter sp.]
MKIILSTYSFFPFDFGGSEVYVLGLAQYLQEAGHDVTVYAAVPSDAADRYGEYYEDNHIRATHYVWNDIKVVGIHSKFSTREEIYTKTRAELIPSLIALLRKGEGGIDLLHIHANTLLNGTNFIAAAKLVFGNVKVVTSYHLPLNCVKSDLLYDGKIRACNVKVDTGICTSCFIASNTVLPHGLSDWIQKILPRSYFPSLPTAFNLRYLVSGFISNFSTLKSETDHWVLYSNEVKEILMNNGVSGSSISMIRHGINPVFPSFATGYKENEPLQFCFSSRMFVLKGFFTLLTAWLGLEETNIRHLNLVGNIPPQLTHREKLLIEKAKQRRDISWIAPLPQAELAGLLGKMHCVIIPSECVETGPLVFHEAIAAGADVIASNLGGCAELGQYYRDKTSLFTPGNSDSLQSAIEDFQFSNKRLPVLEAKSHYLHILDIYQSLLN